MNPLFAAYRNFTGSSNLLTKAAAYGKPILVSQGACMGRRISEYGIGIAIPEENIEACREAIVRLCREGAPKPENFTIYASEHSRTKLADTLRQLITNHS